MYNINSLIQCTEYSVLAVLFLFKIHGNWSIRKHCEQVWSSFLEACTALFYWFMLCFYALFTVFSVFQNFRHTKSRFPWNSVFFCFLPKFYEFVLFFHIAENWGFNQMWPQYDFQQIWYIHGSQTVCWIWAILVYWWVVIRPFLFI